jgi:hypothetical protein
MSQQSRAPVQASSSLPPTTVMGLDDTAERLTMRCTDSRPVSLGAP